MEIEDYGRARVLVTSHGQTFLVDLVSFDLNGGCTCAHFLSRLKPEINRARELGNFIPGHFFRCPHIRAARDFILDQHFLPRLLELYPDNEDS